MEWLSCSLKSQERYPEAEGLERKTVNVKEKYLPETYKRTHEKTLKSVASLAETIALQGRHMEAEELLLKHMDMLGTAHAPDAAPTLDCTLKLAGHYLRVRELGKAHKYFTKFINYTKDEIVGPVGALEASTYVKWLDARASDWSRGENVLLQAKELAPTILGPAIPNHPRHYLIPRHEILEHCSG